MVEKQIERKLINAVRSRGGICPKFISPGWDGVPDRLILLPGGHISFAELKTLGKKPRALQLHRKRQLEALGFRVFIIDSIEQIGVILNEIQAS